MVSATRRHAPGVDGLIAAVIFGSTGEATGTARQTNDQGAFVLDAAFSTVGVQAGRQDEVHAEVRHEDRPEGRDGRERDAEAADLLVEPGVQDRHVREEGDQGQRSSLQRAARSRLPGAKISTPITRWASPVAIARTE